MACPENLRNGPCGGVRSSGLSDPVDIGHKGYRDWAVEVMNRIIDELGVDRISLAGASGGGV